MESALVHRRTAASSGRSFFTFFRTSCACETGESFKFVAYFYERKIPLKTIVYPNELMIKVDSLLLTDLGVALAIPAEFEQYGYR
jgi:hypothetical protein